MTISSLVEKMYRQRVYRRHDESPLTFYFNTEDFPGLRAVEFSFDGHKGQRLKGFFYSYENAKADRLIVFDHGMGSGHRGYLREIERIAKEGYTVFAYDHTGTGNSEGENINGFCQSLNDLDHCLKALKGNGHCEGKTLAVIGHSWGGFSTLNITALHPDITHTVAISGFLSATKIVEQSFTGLLRLYRKMILNIEQNANPDYFGFDARESLKKTDAKVLVIYSKDDPVVRYKYHFAPLEKDFYQKDGRITILSLRGKKHSPNYTKDALKYKDEYFADLEKKLKKSAFSDENGNISAEKAEEYKKSFDWWRMTAQDEKIWQAVFRHLEK